MTGKRANIKVKRSTFKNLKDDKPDGVTWSHYLEEMCSTD